MRRCDRIEALQRPAIAARASLQQRLQARRRAGPRPSGRRERHGSAETRASADARSAKFHLRMTDATAFAILVSGSTLEAARLAGQRRRETGADDNRTTSRRIPLFARLASNQWTRASADGRQPIEPGSGLSPVCTEFKPTRPVLGGQAPAHLSLVLLPARFGWQKRAVFPVKPLSVGQRRSDRPNGHEISREARFAEQRKRVWLSDCYCTTQNDAHDRLATGPIT